MKDWKEKIKNFNITYINSVSELKELMNKTPPPLITTRCSAVKTGKSRGFPKEIYHGTLNLMFYKMMEARFLRYGILSDLYRLAYDDERIDDYDIHPSSLTIEAKQKIGELIKTKAAERNYEAIIFYSRSPIMSKPYFEMLYYSGLKVYYVNHLYLFSKLKIKSLF